MMQQDDDLAVRAAAAACLGHFVLMAEWGQIEYAVGERVVAALSETYEHPATAENVRRASLESLGSSADPRVAQYIQDAYRSGGEQLQMSAVFAMGRSADNRWTSTIMQEMENPDWEMRLEAARAAGGIGSSDAVDRLIELLDDDFFEVRLAAVGALGQIGSDQAYEALAMRLDDEQAYDLHDAIEDAIDEIEWLGGELDLSLFEWDEDDLSL
jgi:HEAT repeat protein